MAKKDEGQLIPSQGSLDDILTPAMNEEEALTAKAHGVSLANLQERTDRAIAIVDARTEILTKIRKATIVMTEPQHWTLTRLEDGREVASLRADGAYSVMDLWGVEVSNLRWPDGTPASEPMLIKEGDGSWTAVIIGDVRSNFTARAVEGVRASRNSKERFIGRSTGAAFLNEAVMLSDLRGAVRTLLDNKAVRVVTGTGKVSIDVLKRNGIDTDKCVKGHGYGSSGERRTEREVDPALLKAGEEFWNTVVGYAGGDKEAALKILVEVSEFTMLDDKKKAIVENGQPKMKRPSAWRDLVASGRDGWLKQAMKRFEARVTKETAGAGE